MTIEQLIAELSSLNKPIIAYDTRSGELSEVSSLVIKKGRMFAYLDHPTDEDFEEFS